MKLQRASHCLYQIRYHMVFCLKYRRGLLLLEERCDYLKQILKEIAERYWFEIEQMGTDGDHIHIFVGAAPKYAPSRVMQILKSISAKELFKRFPELRKQLWGGELWSDGGYIGTVGDGVNSEIDQTLHSATGNGAREGSSATDALILSLAGYPAACCDWVLHFKEQIFIDMKPSYYEFANQTLNLTEAEVFAKFASSENIQAT